MSGFSDVITLCRQTIGQDGKGAVVPQIEKSDVFFNRFSIGLAERVAGASSGLKGLATGQVRSVDYDGQPTAILGGKEYTVEDAQDNGEFTTLTLSRRLIDG